MHTKISLLMHTKISLLTHWSTWILKLLPLILITPHHLSRIGMVCTFDSKCTTKVFRNQLDFSCNSDWADVTCRWSEPRKRKMPKKKEAPALTSKVSPQKAGAGGGRTNGRYNPGESLKRRNPVYLKALESRSAGYTGRFQKNGGGEDDNYMEVYREPVKCKVVNFQGLGSSSHFCVSSDMMSINSVQSEMMLRSVGEQYPANCWGDGAVDDSVLTHRSDQSMGSTINLDSGHKQSEFCEWAFGFVKI